MSLSVRLPLACRYGLVYPGLGWVMWRSVEYLPEEMIFYDNYLGEVLPRESTA